MFTMWAHVTAELMKTNARDVAGSSCGQQTTQGACVSNRAVQDRGRRSNQSHLDLRPMAEVSFLPSANIRKRASACREGHLQPRINKNTDDLAVLILEFDDFTENHTVTHCNYTISVRMLRTMNKT